MNENEYSQYVLQLKLLVVINVLKDTPSESLKTAANLFNSEVRRNTENGKALITFLYMLKTKAKSKGQNGLCLAFLAAAHQLHATNQCM